jgi:beta-fructofuranosidase
MPSIPEFILHKLYVPDSLRPIDGGFLFELNNSFAPVNLTGVAINVDSHQVDAGNIYLSLPGLGEIPAGGISGESLFALAVNMTLQVCVYAPEPRQRMVIRADTREAGVLQFGIDVDFIVAEPVKKKKASFLSKTNRRLQYATKVFRVQQDPQHPSYHFAPPSNWMNDPNGLIYWKGKYHLFYQYNPFEPAWGNIHWGHASSRDMLHWKHLPIALWPEKNGPDAGGCFSGCTVDNDGTPTLIYTGVYPETQCLATSQEADLLHWQRRSTPVVPQPPEGMQLEGFRDPCVWREATEWRMVLGSGLTDVGGAVLLYRSKNLLDWQYVGILFHNERRSAEPIDTGTMWECPSFFPLEDKWVLIVSVCAAQGPLHTLYYTGQYRVDRFIPDGPPRLVDGGIPSEGNAVVGPCFYAPQTFVEKKGKRVMIGWLREARNAADQASAGWSGTLSLPRYLFLSQRGELCCTPTDEIRALRHTHELLTKSNPLSESVSGACLEMLIRIPPDTEQWSGVHLTSGRIVDDNVLIGVDSVNGSLVVDCRHAGGTISITPVQFHGLDELLLHVFVDGSIIEVYVEDKFPISARFYMQKPQGLRVRQVGEASAEMWKLKI